jgi:predicted DNA-binding protein (MmcQ/YjbR family)
MHVTIDNIRSFCLALAGTTEDVKWQSDLVFSVGGKMYAVACLDPPHTVAFKCTPDAFVELVEREGIIPAPYLARAMWVQERGLGESLDRRERERLLRTSYELVSAKLPKKRVTKKAPAKRKRRARSG